MAAPSTTDPEIDAFVQGLRNVLMQVPARNRSGFFRHVEDMLEVWGRMLERDDVWQCRASSHEEHTTTPEDTLREAGISSRRQAKYQRRMASLLAGRAR
jgi:hypothetical protein